MNTSNPSRLFRVLSLFLFPVLAACGGGGSSGFVPPPPPPGGSGWQPGVFLDASTFRNQCENPRSGIDPATNQPFVDVQGTTLDENNFLRSHSDNTYLWYSEIVDQDPGLFNDSLVYFDQLRTFEASPSGPPKDKFHFTIPTAEYFQLAQSGVVAGYGVTWSLLSAAPPREIAIAYTEPNSPATNLPIPLARGARVLSVDGEDLINGNDVDTLNAGLFPVGTGELHEFEILDLGSSTPRLVQLTSEDVTTSPVQNVSFVDTATGRIGYMQFNDHILTAEDALVDAVNQLNSFGIDDLVLDIRYNGGGFLFIASQLSYMIGGPLTAGQPFETLQFNDKHPVTNPITGEALQPTPFYNGTTTSQPLPVLNLPIRRVYVLTGPGTCSASESIMNSLRGIDVEVIQIGSTTCGKPYGFYEAGNCGTSYFTIQFRGVNAKNFGDYTDGFSPQNSDPTSGIVGTVIPGCSIGDDFDSQLGSPAEARFAAALTYRDTGVCPAATGVAGPGLNKIGGQATLRDGVVVKNPWLMNRTVGRP